MRSRCLLSDTPRTALPPLIGAFTHGDGKDVGHEVGKLIDNGK